MGQDARLHVKLCYFGRLDLESFDVLHDLRDDVEHLASRFLPYAFHHHGEMTCFLDGNGVRKFALELDDDEPWLKARNINHLMDHFLRDWCSRTSHTYHRERTFLWHISARVKGIDLKMLPPQLEVKELFIGEVGSPHDRWNSTIGLSIPFFWKHPLIKK